jgi:hypothetical protein
MPADAKVGSVAPESSQLWGAKRIATITGRQLWKTMAPVMLPIASVSFPCLIQMMLLNFSGNSVAIGAMIRASTAGATPRSNDSF